MAVETRVNDVDFSRIGIGQKTNIRLEAFPDREFHGKVTTVAGIAKDRSDRRQGMLKRSVSGVMIFDLVVEIDEEDPRLRPTMTATVDIIVDELSDAISLPYRAIMEQEDRKFVYVQEDGKTVERDIETGLAGASRIVVTEGLNEGEVVVVSKRKR